MTGDRDPRRGRGATRERILDATLDLFNRRGPDRVTTAEIARTVEINEGNLYYHFRTKESLVLALFERFEAAAGALVDRTGAAPRGEARVYGEALAEWFSIVWRYRFLFRDLLALAAATPCLVEPIRSLSARMRVAVEALIHRMIAEGFIEVSQEDLSAVLANVWIVSTYWAVYLSLQEGIEDLEDTHLDWGLNQVASLFKPYLTPSAADAVFSPR
ncbi:TetR family transcriptional regulator [Aureimonas sp. Leaf454]|uniref:TetR/AcrR family transcriptional regulator n=1 Tax=Aureimonas sp. Leaf454 TaxID=1736381 RepID=UPI000702276F|nr:TetR/AcrR family transcriptional regulator [Aureimonas sp. Leaf454]KQT51991.1 TetR family transcriptional regulator [Aureimonas sp. Leaf454]